MDTRKLDAGAGDSAGDSPHVSDADVVANGGDGMSRRGKNRENVTNEAKIDKTAIIIQDKDIV